MWQHIFGPRACHKKLNDFNKMILYFLCQRGVPAEAAVDTCIAVCFERILRVEGDIGRRLPFVGQTVCLDLGARHHHVPPTAGKKMIRNYAELSVRIKK